MSTFVQQRYFGLSSSSTWMLLLLSLYFSWICPAESNVVPLPDLSLVVTQRISDAAVYSLADFRKASTRAVAHFSTLLPSTLVTQPLAQQKQGEALLPASNVVVQLKAHRPRSACAIA